MAIVPCGHRLVVTIENLEDVDPAFKKAKSAGIVIPEHEDIQRQKAGVDKGRVVAIGPDCWKAFHYNANPVSTVDVPFTPWCSVGDLVVFAKYSGKVVKDPTSNKEFIVLSDEDVVAVIKE